MSSSLAGLKKTPKSKVSYSPPNRKPSSIAIAAIKTYHHGLLSFHMAQSYPVISLLADMTPPRTQQDLKFLKKPIVKEIRLHASAPDGDFDG